MMSKKKAFTLVELVIVILIIGLFVTVVLPRVAGIKGRARDVERKSDIQQLVSALSNYQLNNGNYPTGSGGVDVVLRDLAPVYVRTLPGDPSGMRISTTHGSQSVKGQYIYLSLESKKGYVVMSVSEGGGMHANWISNAGSLTLTGSNPGLISTREQVSVINRSLCNSVSDGSIARTGSICRGILDSYEAKYIVAVK